MQDLKSEEQGSNGTALFLVALFIAIGGAGGYYLRGTKADPAASNGVCYNACFRNSSLLVRELYKKNYINNEKQTKLLEIFQTNCQEECAGNKPTEE